MAFTLTRKKVIITAVVLVLVFGGIFAYLFLTNYFSQQQNTTTEPAKIPSTGNAYQQRLTNVQTEVTDLAAAGDEQSVQKADTIIDTEIKNAKDSGNEAYVVDASSAKATLLIDTDRPQEGLDLLLALEQQYGDNDEYKYELYALISWAYRELDNTAKADEYYNKIPGRGWD